jgi:hypothetical protein
MKFLAIVEWDPEDFDKLNKRGEQSTKEREEGTEKYPKWLFPPHKIIGKNKSFMVYEGTPEQLTNVEAHWHGLSKWKFIPIIEGPKSTELFKKRLK